MERLLKLFNRDKVLSIRFLIIFIILIYIPMALYISFVYTRTIDAVEEEKIDAIKQILGQTSQSVNLVLDNIQKGVLKTAEHNGIQAGVQNFENLTEYYKDKVSEFTKQQFGRLKDNISYIDDVACITKNGQIIYSDDNIAINSEKFFQSNTYRSLMASDSNILWSFGAFDYIEFKSNENETILLVYEILNLDNSENVGYGFVTIDNDSFRLLYKNTFIGKTGGLIIYDENRNPVLNTTEYNISKTVLDSLAKKQRFSTIHNVDISKKQYLLGVAPLFPTDWFILAIAPRDELTKTIKTNIINNFTPIILISLAISILIIIESLVLSRAVTEKKMTNYRLVVSEKMNERLRVYKHDFINHLQIIWGLMELENYDEALNYLIKASNEGITIRERYEIGIPEIESAIFSILSEAREKNIEVEIYCIKLESKLFIKTYDLTKIITNLLKNAMYALENTDYYDKKLKIKIYEELGYYVFEIINNVPIITEDIKEKIFQKGFTTKGKEGSGLGLYIVKRLAEKNKGIVELHVDEEGNHFIVKFPY